MKYLSEQDEQHVMKEYEGPPTSPPLSPSDSFAEERCETCKFWNILVTMDDEWDGTAKTKVAHMKSDKTGVCRRRAPIATGYRTWPHTHMEDYCGDYRQHPYFQLNARQP